jgi:7-cyano-7-deazaguanine synthase in queuosine biosynthesis
MCVARQLYARSMCAIKQQRYNLFFQLQQTLSHYSRLEAYAFDKCGHLQLCSNRRACLASAATFAAVHRK